MKKILIFGVALIIILPIAWYLISPIFRVVEVNEASPLDEAVKTQRQESAKIKKPEPQIKDSMESMKADEMKKFNEEVEKMKDVVMEKDDSMPLGPRVLAEGEFKPRAHDVMGNAILIEKDGKKYLRFEDFETINGPELHIYLSTELGGEDIIDLGIIKATKGNVNYEIPDDVDLEKYNKVLVWCKPFKVLFSYSELEHSS